MDVTNITTAFEVTNSGHNVTVTQYKPINCLPLNVVQATDETRVRSSDVIVAAVNFPVAVTTVLLNLSIITTIARTPSLQVPINVLLCSLAFADGLSGLVVQPVFILWRLLLHHVRDVCRLVHLYHANKSLPFLLVGGTFLNLSITSVDRWYAVFRPIAYRRAISNRGVIKIVVGAWIFWTVFISVMETLVPELVYEPLEAITLSLLIVVPVIGHILTFAVIHGSNKKIRDAIHNLQHAVLFKREKKIAIDMTFFTMTTVVSILPIIVLLNVDQTVFTVHLLLPWATTVSFLASSLNPAIQLWRNMALRDALKATLLKFRSDVEIVIL